MSDVICNTSPIQYLHQLRLLHILRELADEVVVPPAVMQELEAGLAQGIDLPDMASQDWMTIRRKAADLTLPAVTDLGRGEVEVLAMALATPGAVAVLDDRLARRAAASMDIPFTGTLGLLLDAKHVDLVPAVEPILDQLVALRFRLDGDTRALVLRRAGEAP